MKISNFLVHPLIRSIQHTQIQCLSTPLLSTELSIAFLWDVYITPESRPANICVLIVEGSIQRLQPISLTLTTSPGSASRKYQDLTI